MFDSFSGLLQKAAITQPLAIILDDLHWADASSLIFLEFFVCHIRQSRIVIVGTFRDFDHGKEYPMPSALGALVSHSLSHSMPLARFSERQTAQFLARYGGESPPRELVTVLHEKTDGNPLFVSELATLLVARKRRKRGKLIPAEIRIPRTLRQVIMRRVYHLSPRTVRVLAVGSAIGWEFDADILVAVSVAAATDALVALDEARAAGVIVEVPNRGLYRFSHGLIREALYEELVGDDRVDVHYRIGRVLEDQCSTVVESQIAQIAYHYCQAIPKSGWEKAVEYCLLAGARAAGTVAYEDAVLHYGRALHALGGSRENSSRRCKVLLNLGDVQAKAGKWSAARKTFATAAKVARELGDVTSFGEAAVGFKGVLASTDPVDEESVALLEEAVYLLQDSGSAVLVKVIVALALAGYYAWPAHKRVHLGERAVELAELIGHQPTLCAALEARFFGQWRPEGVRDGLATLDRITRLATSTGENESAVRARILRYMCLIELGEVIESEREWIRCVELAGEIRQPRYLWQIAVVAGGRALSRGDLRDAVLLWQKARVLGGQVHNATAEHYFLLQRFCGLRLIGCVDELYDVFPRVAARSMEIPAYQAALGSICCACGRVEEGRKILHLIRQSGFDRLLDNGFGLFCAVLVAEMVSHLGESGCAEEMYRLLLPYADHNVVVSWGAACEGSASHSLGMLAGTLSRWEDASRHFEDAVVMNRKLGAVPFVARSQHYYGEAVWKRNGRGDRARAHEAVMGAIETYRHLEMRGFLRQALALMKCWKSERPESSAAPLADGSGVQAVDVLEAGAGVSMVREAEGGLCVEGRIDERASVHDSRLSDLCMFRREGQYWTIVFRGVVSRLRSTVGLECLAYLVSRPHQEIPAIDLASAMGRRGTRGYAAHVSDVSLVDGQVRVGLGDAGPIFDRRAREAYRGRMKDLLSEAEEAEEMNDVGKASALREEIERIREEVATGCGIGGRSRAAASAFERARINVRNSMSNAFRTIAIYDRALWRHLTNSVRTGALCCYDPEDDVPWIVST